MGSTGEGSRGGKIIRHTAGGRAVYASAATAAAASGRDPHPGARDYGHQGVAGGAHVPPAGATKPILALGRDNPSALDHKIAARLASKHAYQATQGMRITGDISQGAHAKAAAEHDQAARLLSGQGKHEEAAEHAEKANAHRMAASGQHSHAMLSQVFERAGEARIGMAHSEKAEAEKKAPLHGNLDRPAVLNKPGYVGGRRPAHRPTAGHMGDGVGGPISRSGAAKLPPLPDFGGNRPALARHAGFGDPRKR